jgi:hypothetical protein
VDISDAQTISPQSISNLPCPKTTIVELKLARTLFGGGS